MNILQLCPRFPYPPIDGGRISIYNTTKGLARRGHSIDLVTFAETDTDAAAMRAMEEFCRVHVIHNDTKTNLKNFLRSLVRNEPVYITRHRSVKFRAALEELLRSRKFDVVYGYHSAMFPYVRFAKQRNGLIAALRFHNIESLIWKRYAAEERNPIKSFIAAHQGDMLERVEAFAAGYADMNFTITDIDTARLRRLAPSARITTIPPGVDMEYWRERPSQPRETTAMLATTFAWIHNVHGIAWFIREAMPRIIDKFPNFVLHLIGPHPPELLKRHGGDHVTFEGFVPDIRQSAARAGAYIVPLFVGGGIRIKILEAMALGMPVVTTSIGCEGIGGTSGVHYCVADSAEEFAAAVIAILTDLKYAESISRSARSFIENHYSWDRTISMIEEELTRQRMNPPDTLPLNKNSR